MQLNILMVDSGLVQLNATLLQAVYILLVLLLSLNGIVVEHNSVHPVQTAIPFSTKSGWCSIPRCALDGSVHYIHFLR